MKKTLLSILPVVCLIIVIFVGCTAQKPNEADKIATLPTEAGEIVTRPTEADEIVTLPAGDMVFELADTSGIEVKEFDLGEGSVKNSAGETLPCPLNGIIALPEGTEQCPVVIAIHGWQDENDIYKDPNYRGFDYLVKQLAAEGYLALSINMNLEYNDYQFGGSENFAFAKAVVAQYMQALESAVNGENAGFGIDLSGRADFENINLIGHSRGSNVSMAIAAQDIAQGSHHINSIICGAPAYFDEELPPDLPIGIICVQRDEDVAGAAQRIFDNIKVDNSRVHSAQLSYLLGGSHSFFNRKMPDMPDSVAPLKRDQQEDFFVHYACAFLSVYAKGQSAFGAFDLNSTQPGKVFGFDAVCSYFAPGALALFTPGDSSTKAVAEKGAELENTEQSFNSDLLFRHPGGPSPDFETDTRVLPLLGMKWREKSSSVRFNLSSVDMKPYTTLRFDIAVKESDKLNPKGQAQSFTLTLRTKDGKESSVIIPKDSPALMYHTGKVKRSQDYKKDIWEGETPLSGLQVPLSLFKGIDIGSVSELIFRFDRTDSGALMLAGIWAERTSGL